jgi:hypothetical protein
MLGGPGFHPLQSASLSWPNASYALRILIKFSNPSSYCPHPHLRVWLKFSSLHFVLATIPSSLLPWMLDWPDWGIWSMHMGCLIVVRSPSNSKFSRLLGTAITHSHPLTRFCDSHIPPLLLLSTFSSHLHILFFRIPFAILLWTQILLPSSHTSPFDNIQLQPCTSALRLSNSPHIILYAFSPHTQVACP